VALLIELILIPLVRALPERTGFLTLWTLIPMIIILATIGIFLGTAQFKKTREKVPLIGFLIGELVLVIFALYGLAPWFGL
jgi:hypothetical protein